MKPGDDIRDGTHGGARFWITAAAGWAVMGYGRRGLLHHHIDTRPANLATFVVGGALFHDLIFAPAVLGIGAAVARAVLGRTRAIVQGALIVSVPGPVRLPAGPRLRPRPAQPLFAPPQLRGQRGSGARPGLGRGRGAAQAPWRLSAGGGDLLSSSGRWAWP